MKNLLLKIKKALNKVLNFLPSRLPIGMVEFNLWADSIISTYDLPDNDSVRFGLATAILHLESSSKVELMLITLLFPFVPVIKLPIPMSGAKSKRYFGQLMLKGAANQVAGGVMQDLKQKQADAIKAAEEAKNNAVETTATEV